MAVSVFKGAGHSGAGCTPGDIVADWPASGVPAVAIWFGQPSLFADRMFAARVPGFIQVLLFGVAFQ